ISARHWLHSSRATRRLRYSNCRTSRTLLEFLSTPAGFFALCSRWLKTAILKGGEYASSLKRRTRLSLNGTFLELRTSGPVQSSTVLLKLRCKEESTVWDSS